MLDLFNRISDLQQFCGQFDLRFRILQIRPKMYSLFTKLCNLYQPHSLYCMCIRFFISIRRMRSCMYNRLCNMHSCIFNCMHIVCCWILL